MVEPAVTNVIVRSYQYLTTLFSFAVSRVATKVKLLVGDVYSSDDDDSELSDLKMKDVQASEREIKGSNPLNYNYEDSSGMELDQYSIDNKTNSDKDVVNSDVESNSMVNGSKLKDCLDKNLSASDLKAVKTDQSKTSNACVNRFSDAIADLNGNYGSEISPIEETTLNDELNDDVEDNVPDTAIRINIPRQKDMSHAEKEIVRSNDISVHLEDEIEDVITRRQTRSLSKTLKSDQDKIINESKSKTISRQNKERHEPLNDKLRNADAYIGVKDISNNDKHSEKDESTDQDAFSGARENFQTRTSGLKIPGFVDFSPNGKNGMNNNHGYCQKQDNLWRILQALWSRVDVEPEQGDSNRDEASDFRKSMIESLKCSRVFSINVEHRDGNLLSGIINELIPDLEDESDTEIVKENERKKVCRESYWDRLGQELSGRLKGSGLSAEIGFDKDDHIDENELTEDSMRETNGNIDENKLTPDLVRVTSDGVLDEEQELGKGDEADMVKLITDVANECQEMLDNEGCELEIENEQMQCGGRDLEDRNEKSCANDQSQETKLNRQEMGQHDDDYETQNESEIDSLLAEQAELGGSLMGLIDCTDNLAGMYGLF